MSLQAWLLTFLMFGRHPRLAIDAFLGIHPDNQRKEGEYVSGLKRRLQFAYKVASRGAIRQGRRHKRQYDTKLREAVIQHGDRVLVRNIGLTKAG